MIRAALALLFSVITTATIAAPYVPADDAAVLERLPLRRGERADAPLLALRAAWLRQPDSVATSASLAREYLRRARMQSDPRYLGYAQAVLAPWAQHARPPIEIQVLRATAAQSLHDFDGALRDLDAALKRAPDHAQARLTRAAVNQARGELAEARRDCEQLAGIAADVIAQACGATVDALTGNATRSYARIAALRAQLAESNRDVAAWLDGLLAEFAQRGNYAARAERHYMAALAVEPDDAFTRAAYADFLLDHERPTEVVALLRAHTRADGLLLRYTLAQRRLRAAETPELIKTLDARFSEARARGTALHLREEAVFALKLLDEAPRALQLARENWQAQREPADARILLETALAAGDVEAAQPVVAWMKHNNMRDPILDALAADACGI